ncbi:hypothetical protein BJX68DRAFT_262513 [Aspergillus pseudodeflectus]|uniref:Uncharacterized protein n=1 Tax=Aspergillus pseudodeflectus TaxID=176178 RepID=A0ABR4L3D0_9EURO
MCWEWLIDHIPFLLPEWVRPKIESFILNVALTYYEIGMSLVLLFAVYWGSLLSIPAVAGALLMPIVEDVWDTIGRPVYVRVERRWLRVRGVVELYVPRVFLLPVIWWWRWMLR